MRRCIYLAIVMLILSAPVSAETLPRDSLFSVPLKFIEQNGAPAKLSDFSSHDIILAMVYTSCRAACPLTVQRLQRVEKLLSQSGSDASFVLVSLDPARDTPEAMQMFKDHHKLDAPHWHLLTAEPEDVRKLAVLIGVSYAADPSTQEIMHSNKIILLSKTGNISTVVDGLDGDLQPLVERVVADK